MSDIKDKYPFGTIEELKESISQIDISLDISNLSSSLKLAARDLKDAISKDVYDLMMARYKGDTITPPQGDPPADPALELSEAQGALLDELVEMCQGAIANFAVYHHLIWLQIRLSNNGVTTLKNNNETTAFKYQTDEAKIKLLDRACLEITEIIDHLEANKTFYTQWVASSQYTYLQNLVIKSYRDFSEQYEISNNASFFIRTRFLQAEVIDDHILPRIKLADLTNDVKLTKLTKKAVAFKTMAMAIKRFDYFLLPESIRKELGNEYFSSTRFRDIDLVKENLFGDLNTKGDEYLANIDMYLAAKTNTDTTANTYEDLDQAFNGDYPFAAII
jgi:hypothetical protein